MNENESGLEPQQENQTGEPGRRTRRRIGRVEKIAPLRERTTTGQTSQTERTYRQDSNSSYRNSYTGRQSYGHREQPTEGYRKSYRAGRDTDTPYSYEAGSRMSRSNSPTPTDGRYSRRETDQAEGRQRPQGQGRPPYGKPGTQRNNNSQKRNPYSQKKVLRYKEENVDPNEPIRLNRYLANAGVCSRREADKHIVAGQVKVNGEVVTELGVKVLRSDDVRFKGVKVSPEDKIYLLLNKPRGYVTTLDDPENRKTVMELVKGACPERIYPVGRLDQNTTGVLLFTNDGEMAAKLMHPQYLKKKIYHVFLNKELAPEDLQKLLTGIELEDGVMAADAAEYAKEDDHTQVGIEIHSGRNRIVRRLFEALGYRVYKLDRVYFAGLTKKHLKRGAWRFLTPKEVSMLRMGAFE